MSGDTEFTGEAAGTTYGYAMSGAVVEIWYDLCDRICDVRQYWEADRPTVLSPDVAADVAARREEFVRNVYDGERQWCGREEIVK